MPLLFLSSAVTSHEAACPSHLDPKVEGLLSPVLRARHAAFEKGDAWDKGYEAAFYRLLSQKGPSAQQARVALMDYYIGEAYAEELVCSVAKDGSVALLKLYARCDIPPKAPSGERDRALPLRDYALAMISRGHVVAECTYE